MVGTAARGDGERGTSSARGRDRRRREEEVVETRGEEVSAATFPLLTFLQCTLIIRVFPDFANEVFSSENYIRERHFLTALKVFSRNFFFFFFFNP